MREPIPPSVRRSYICRIANHLEETKMSASTRQAQDIATVQSGFEAIAVGDLPAFSAGFHADATWNHRNDDQIGGVHAGTAAIVNFVTTTMQLTAGTMKPQPTAFMADGEGHVVVLMHMTASRPDGRMLDDRQVLVFEVRDGLINSVEQFVGNPTAVTEFWA